MPKENIIVIEDDENISELICFTLRKEGYTASKAYSAKEAFKLIKEQDFNIALLDIMLPDIDGFDVCKELKACCPDIGVIMLTAKTDETDIVCGLEIGADDYMTKPFSPRILIARIKSLLRKISKFKEYQKENEKEIFVEKNGIKMIPQKHFVSIEDEEISLTANEYKLLLLFISKPGRVWSRDNIIEYINGEGYAVTDRAIDVQIAGLRKKLADKAHLLETVRGFGYKFTDK